MSLYDELLLGDKGPDTPSSTGSLSSSSWGAGGIKLLQNHLSSKKRENVAGKVGSGKSFGLSTRLELHLTNFARLRV